MLVRRLTDFFGYVGYESLAYRAFSKGFGMSESDDVITSMASLENVFQEIENPASTKKWNVDIISAVKALIPEIISSAEMERKCVYFKKLSENAHIPTYGSEWAAGADLYSAYDCVIPAKDKASVGTDLQVQIPRGHYGRIAPRSGLAVQKFIDVGAGVVDSDYRGHLSVVVFNFGTEDFHVKKGDRIAQFICEKISHCDFIEVKSLDKSDRGTGGFGSTGV
ncbi:dUTP diphosphatase [Loa loa]|uniref:Deoxyuridine 5'-triphosphate nucleotidohydrolase n=1 Tax=Loa loa TaxID=7209 RepID=A0A1I7W288_LOALO|nr:dUTP diphosphatase [Loa loa]EFO15355.2 dUTP diphosphatase [Loa loa]